MHILQPKATKLKPDEVKKLLVKYNIALNQLPKIKSDDAGIPENCAAGDVVKLERKEDDKINLHFRVVV